MSIEPINPAPPSIQVRVRSAMGFWERARVVYNLALIALVLVRYAIESSDPAVTFDGDVLLNFFALAVVANVLYCFAYVVDLVVQWGGFAVNPLRWRVPIWLIGTAFAMTLAYFISQGIFTPEALRG